jgi:L-fucose isomerase-like protein
LSRKGEKVCIFDPKIEGPQEALSYRRTMNTLELPPKRTKQPSNGHKPSGNGRGLPALGVTSEILESIVPRPATAKPTPILVIGTGVKIHFPWDQANRRYRKACELISKAVDPKQIQVVTCPEPFEDPLAMLDALNKGLAQGVGGIILFHAAYTAGEIGSHLGRWLIDHPMPLLSWSFPDEASERLSANSLCCQNFILNMLSRMGIKYVWQHAELDESALPFVQTFSKSVRARERFRHARVLHAGGSRVTAFYDGETDELSVMKQFGLRFDRVDLEAVHAHGKKFTDKQIQSVREAIVKSSLCGRNDVPDVQSTETIRFGLSVLDLANKHGYVGCTVKSWPDLFDHYGCAIDASISMMNDYGFCAAEEGEMNGLISSLALFFVSEGQAITTMMDISVADAKNNRVGIWHCGASPTRLLKKGTKYEARRHSILENGDPETAVGMMLEFLLELGPITVARYQSPDASRAFIFEGNFVDAPMPFRGNYGEMVPVDGVKATDIVSSILSNGLDHHWSVGYGHYSKELQQLNHWLGVKEIPITASPTLSGLSR